MNSINEKLIYSELESKRFKANIYRGYLDDISVKDINSFVIKNNIDHLIFRIKSDKLDEVAKLENTPFPYIVADTLIYYSCDLTKSETKEFLNKGIVFKKANIGDSELLDDLVDIIFKDYKNHYYANPFLNKDSIIEGYKEWVLNYLNDDNSKIVFKVINNGKTIAFAACSFNKLDRNCEVVLNGVFPQYAGGGIYTDLIRYTKNYFKEKGYSVIKISTQSHNYAVQKVWAKESFFISHSYNTIHINSLLNKSDLKEDVIDFEFNDEAINDYISISRDKTYLFKTVQFIKDNGFGLKIYHDVLINYIISNYFKRITPGGGTVFLDYRYCFLKPFDFNKKYYAKISFPQYENASNRYLAVIKVFDLDNNICLISYSNLLKK